MEKSFRNYEELTVTDAVTEHYRKMRTNQTYDYAMRMRKKYLTYKNPMPIWESILKLNELVDVSDPDINLPNVQHLVQTAEALREDNRPDWMQLVGLIHDLGKIMFVWGSDKDGTSHNEQWGLVGDIFVIGCALPDVCIYPEFNKLNADMYDNRYNTPLGIYEAGCGLAWGHDEYLYNVLKNHKDNTIPKAGMAMIRYHSFIRGIQVSAYKELLSDKDKQYLEWVTDFNKYDLYTKSPKIYNLEEIKDYYMPIAKKYLGDEPIYW